MKIPNGMTQERIEQLVAQSRPERLSAPGKQPITSDHVAHIVQLTMWGHTTLAADHLLFPELNGYLKPVVAGVIRQLNIAFVQMVVQPGETAEEIERKVRVRQYSYEMLIEMAINFLGMESRWLDVDERGDCIDIISETLSDWEAVEAAEGDVSVAVAVVRRFLTRMKWVMKGASMVAKTAGDIEQALNFSEPIMLDFLDACADAIDNNIYTHMVTNNICRFGNDYALGLRWLRHLGFEQVSTNPVLAALAYSDDPELSQLFQSEVKSHHRFAAWKADPDRFADEIALYATLLALWDNLHVYRPIFFNLASSSGGGVVSFQLNPNIAHLAEQSIKDVFSAFAEATADLKVYDDYLLAGYSATRERGRPNMVIKVAASSPAAREIARTINAYGFGSNITVIYTCAQEVTMILEELRGMAYAMKKGIVPTQLYMTNMGGRFESHLREEQLAAWFAEAKAKLGEDEALRRVEQLAAANGAKIAGLDGYERKVAAATDYGKQHNLDANVATALQGIVSADELEKWEDAIGKSGTLVARRVWGIFFSEGNRAKWINYLCWIDLLTEDQATLLLDRLCYLPASKRKPEDTYWTLASRNMVHTEFPNHQQNVQKMSEPADFDLIRYDQSITGQFAADVLARLNTLEDFRKGYELNDELNPILQDAGIEGDFGSAGHTPEEWAEYGSVQKTLSQFTAAYDKFRDDMLMLFRETLS